MKKQHTHKYKIDHLVIPTHTETHTELTLRCSCGRTRKVKRKHQSGLKHQRRPRQRLRKASVKKQSWNKLYYAQTEADLPIQACAMTGVRDYKENLERHHVARRLGQRILIYCYLTQKAHALIENNTVWARQQGWLRNEGQGYPKDDTQPRPWREGTLINEHLLDSKI